MTWKRFWVQTHWCAVESSAGPLATELDFGGADGLSGQVCFVLQKREKRQKKRREREREREFYKKCNML
jgi:hypothetical protein